MVSYLTNRGQLRPQLREGERGNMNLLSMRKCSWAMSGAFVAFLTFAAHGSANVFDDAVFWFRGGKDINGDGCMQQGEFFDDLHANDTNHPNHKAIMVNYLVDSKSKAFRSNASFVPENVVFPALGKSVTNNINVLRLSNKAVKDPQTEKYNFWPEWVNPRSIFVNNNIEREYTIVSRMRLDNDIVRTQCVFKIGHNATAKQGFKLGFSELQTSTNAKYITGQCTPAENGNDESFQFTSIQIPTNTWFDMAVVVGNGKLRVGIALPESLSIHGDNPTIAFDEKPMWTANSLPDGDYYRLFCYNGQDTYQLQEDADMTCFVGSVQQLAIWGRALSDQEVMAAFGMPRPAIFRTGFDNGTSNEFGGTRSSSTQTIDGLGSWQNIANTMKSGDTWTVNFNALRDEANLPQIFSIKSLPGSAAAQIEVELNETPLGEGRVAADSRAFWPVATNIVREGENELVITRKDGRVRDFLIDAMELGGSLGVGTITGSSTDDGRVDPRCIETGVPSAADPNTQHWPQELMPYSGITNLHLRVWVDPDVVDKASFVFRTAAQAASRSSTQTATGSEYFSIYVNGDYKTKLTATTKWRTYDPTFNPGDLRGGWNDFEFITPLPYQGCHWHFGYFRFETVLSSPFGFSTLPGMKVIIR